MTIDLAIILAYFLLINFIGIRYSGASSIQDYFLGNRSVHWVIASLSIVATETSSLTFLSIPGLAYFKGMGFLQVAFGYLIGRILVAVFLLPRYFQGGYETVYQYLQRRFGPRSQRVVSVLFHFTRLFADSVRLFATAIPLTALMEWDYRISLLVIGAATLMYTFYGGLKSVVIVDVLQLGVYIFAASLGIGLIFWETGFSFSSAVAAIPAMDLNVISLSGQDSPWSSYSLLTGLVGGAFLSFASHGTDHIIVQRVLACRDVKSAQRAMIGSGVVIIFQFLLFLFLGLLIKVFLGARPFAASDEVMPFFMIHHVPVGVRGIMLAGIFAAAMSTLASSINSLSSSTTMDIMRLHERDIPEAKKVRFSRWLSLFWAVVLVGLSMLFRNASDALIEVCLSIASVTYGSMMGIFLMGRFAARITENQAIAGVAAGILAVSALMLHGGLFWLWYVTVGFAACVAVSYAAHLAGAWRRRAFSRGPR